MTSSMSLGREYLAIEPVKIFRQPTGIRLVYWLECGASFEGIVVKPKDGQRLLGVLTSRSGQRCLSMPEKQEYQLDELLVNQEMPLASLNPIQEKQKIKWIPISHQILAERELGLSLYLNFFPACNKSTAIVLRRRGRALQTGLIGYKSTQCHQKTLTAKLTGIQNHMTSLELIKERSRLRYTTHVAPIKTGSATTRQDGSTQFRYLRRCNEAPIGIIKRKKQVGVLVARYSPKICTKQALKVTWAPYITKILSKASINQAKKMVASKELILSNPLEILGNSPEAVR